MNSNVKNIVDVIILTPPCSPNQCIALKKLAEFIETARKKMMHPPQFFIYNNSCGTDCSNFLKRISGADCFDDEGITEVMGK